MRSQGKSLLKLKTKINNWFLFLKYPFIGYSHGVTWLDEMPIGWKKAFGAQMCKEIKAALLREGGQKALKEYRIIQVKEKYGSLRWYDEYGNDEVSDIIAKYECISEYTCCVCGRPAKYQTQGWICPYCEDCISEHDPEGKSKRFWYDLDFYGYKSFASTQYDEN